MQNENLKKKRSLAFQKLKTLPSNKLIIGEVDSHILG